MMNTPWMFVCGCALFSFMLPEILAVIQKRPVPMGMNIASALAAALIAGSFVL